MAKRTRKPSATAEWVGGIVTIPTRITGEGEPYRPDMLLWLAPADELIVGMTAARPNELLGLAVENLRETISAPAAGPPGPPARLRVSSDALADELRAAFPDIELVVAPTPELDTVGAALAESVAGAGDDDPGWLGDGLSPEAVGGFFDAMAALWRAAPWESVPGDGPLFSVTVDALEVHHAVAVVIGQLGESRGILLFGSRADRDRYVAIGEAAERGDMNAVQGFGDGSGMPPFVGLNFDRTEDVTPIRLEERETHGWTLAAEDAFPSLICFDAALQERAPTATDLASGEAIARAFARLAEGDALETAWLEAESLERTSSVTTDLGETEVTLGMAADDAGSGATRDADAIPERVYRLRIELEEINWGVPDGEVSRTVEVAGDDTLWDLHHAIQRAFGWDDDHLFDFFVSGKLRDRKSRYVGSPMGDVDSFELGEDEPRSVTLTRLDDLGLVRRRAMRYVFDEHIVHKITVSTIRDGGPDDRGLPRQVDATGKAPSQYD